MEEKAAIDQERLQLTHKLATYRSELQKTKDYAKQVIKEKAEVLA